MEETGLTVQTIDRQALLAFVGYLMIIIIIGVYAARFSSRGMSNYFIGGRKMSMLVVALSALVNELIPAFSLGLLTTIVVSKCTTRPAQINEIWDAMS